MWGDVGDVHHAAGADAACPAFSVSLLWPNINENPLDHAERSLAEADPAPQIVSVAVEASDALGVGVFFAIIAAIVVAAALWATVCNLFRIRRPLPQMETPAEPAPADGVAAAGPASGSPLGGGGGGEDSDEMSPAGSRDSEVPAEAAASAPATASLALEA